MTVLHPSDISAQRTFLGEDDKRWIAEKKRQRAPKVELPSIPDGPCCVRCQNWERPQDSKDFGECRVIVAEVDGPTSARRVMTREQAQAEFLIGVEPLRVRGFAAPCSRYQAKGAT